ncbi:MAG: hypothetical protein M9949_00895 [Candidatus Kapabacteria bacterium]|nr:hypothetical protein [Candidatus Kapabacteria bacterium]
MSYAKMIHDYIDGGLDSTNEQAMFALLSQSDDLRHEFNSQFKMHLAAQEDMSQIAPPIHVTNAIFAGLGMAIPANTVQSPTSSIKRFLNRFAPAILLLLFFGAMGWGLLEYQKNRDLESQLASSNGNASIGNSSNNIPMMSSFSDDDVAANGSNSTGNAVNNDASVNSATSGNSNNANRNNANSFYNSRANSNSGISTQNGQNDYDLASGNLQNSRTSGMNNHIEGSRIQSDKNFARNAMFGSSHNSNTSSQFGNSISMNGGLGNFQLISVNSMIGSKVQIQVSTLQSPFTSPSFENSNLQSPNGSWSGAFLYSINDFSTIGLVVGVESFNQDFKTSDGLHYLQSPELLWFAASYRYTAKDLFVPHIFYPYAQLSAGGTSVGPITKGQVGVIWNVFSTVNLNLGAEVGYLFYNVNGNIHNSSKIGFTSGVTIGF